jgi:CRISPR-associated protein (TIGR02584 family)
MKNNKDSLVLNASAKRILIAVTGLSPQIVTETIYALATHPTQPWIPEAVHLITTTVGKENARLRLLSEDPGWFARLLKDYQLPDIDFSEKNIHVIPRADQSLLEDIRDDVDNTLAADFIANTVRCLTANPYSEVHASIAGGRKTMGFYLGYAMSLYGRPQDRLSHVLVSNHYEMITEFFYPTPYSRVINDKNGQALDCQLAKVLLGDIPFVRMREQLPLALIEGKVSYSQTVDAVQKALPPVRLRLRLASKELFCGEVTIVLSPALLAFYWLHLINYNYGIHYTDDNLYKNYQQLLAQIKDEPAEDKHLSIQEVEDWYTTNKSKVNRILKNRLNRQAVFYLIDYLPKKEQSDKKAKKSLRRNGFPYLSPEQIFIA